MKSLEEMTLDEKVSWACGSVLLAIGEGKFRDAMVNVLIAINHDAFERGRAAGIAQERMKRKARKTG